jgi:hypothetical protein
MSYVGATAEIPAGLIGLNADGNRYQIPGNALAEAEGISLEDGVLAKEPGTRVLGDVLNQPANLQASLNVPLTGTVYINQLRCRGNPARINESTISYSGIALPNNPVSYAYLLPYDVPTNTLLVIQTCVTGATLTGGNPNDRRMRATLETGTGTFLALPEFADERYALIAFRPTAPLRAGTPIVLRVEYPRAPSYTISSFVARLMVFSNPVLSPAPVWEGTIGESWSTTTAPVIKNRSLSPPFVAGQPVLYLAALASYATVGGVARVTWSDRWTEWSIPAVIGGPAVGGIQMAGAWRVHYPQTRFVAMADFWDTETTHRLVSLTDLNTIFVSEPLTPSNLTPALTVGQFAYGTTPITKGAIVPCGQEAPLRGRKMAVFTTGNTTPVRVVGPTGAVTTISKGLSDWANAAPVNGVVHQNRLAVFGSTKMPHAVAFSSPTDHEDFTTTPLIIQTDSGVGERIWCGVNFDGALLVWKYPRGIFYVDSSDPDVTKWTRGVKSIGLGCAPSAGAVLPVDDDVLFLSAEGTFHMLSAVDTKSGVAASDLGSLLKINNWLRDKVNMSELQLVTSVWDAFSRTAYFALPPKGSTAASLILKFDFSARDRDVDGVPLKFSYTYRDTGDALTLYRELPYGISRPLVGDGTAVHLIDQTSATKGGASYPMRAQTPPLDMATVDETYRTQRKNWDFVEVLLEPNATPETLRIEVYLDGQHSHDITVPTNARRVRRRLSGSSYDIAFRVVGDNVSRVTILGWIVSFRPAGERKR